MKNTRVLIVLFIILSIMISLALPITAVALDNDDIVLYELTDLRQSNVKSYKLSDGQVLCRVYPNDVHYLDFEGRYHDIDNSMIRSDLKEYIYKNSANAWNTYFSNDLSQNGSVLLEKDQYSVSFCLVNSGNQVGVNTTEALDKSTSEFDRLLANDERAVVYKDVFKNVDIAYTVMNFGLKEDIILRDKNVPDTYSFDINIEGLSLIESDEGIYFTDSTGIEVFRLGKLYMEDSSGNQSDKVDYRIEKQLKSYRLIITVDTEFLNAEDTVYPVIVDPTVTVSGSATTFDSYVCDLYPNNNYYTSSYLRTGKDTSFGVRRTYMSFTLPNLPNGSVITSSNLKMNLQSYGGTQSSIAYMVSSNWTSSGITWNNKPAYTTTYNSGIGSNIGSNWYSMNATEIVKHWYSGAYPNYGFCIKDSVETSTSVWGTWYSSDSGTNIPVLEITYSDNYTPRTVNVRVLCDETFRDEFTSYNSVMSTQIGNAEIPFNKSWDIDLNVYAYTASSTLPGADCTTGRSNPCNDSICGSTCVNSTATPNHHKNGNRSFFLTNTGVPINELQVVFLGHRMCFIRSDGTHSTGLLGLAVRSSSYALVKSQAADGVLNVRRIQHELSHCYGCYDNGNGNTCTSGQRCIMSGGFDSVTDYNLAGIWCDACRADFIVTAH